MSEGTQDKKCQAIHQRNRDTTTTDRQKKSVKRYLTKLTWKLSKKSLLTNSRFREIKKAVNLTKYAKEADHKILGFQGLRNVDIPLGKIANITVNCPILIIIVFLYWILRRCVSSKNSLYIRHISLRSSFIKEISSKKKHHYPL